MKLDWQKVWDFVPFVSGSIQQRRASDRKFQWDKIVEIALIVGLVIYGDHFQLQDLTQRVQRMNIRLEALHAEMDNILMHIKENGQ